MFQLKNLVINKHLKVFLCFVISLITIKGFDLNSIFIFLQLGHAVKGNYYEKQLRSAPTPGEDFNFEVKMPFLFYFVIGCFDKECNLNDEVVFCLKCLIFCVLFVSIQLLLKALKLL